jgi:hypothetical protein
MLYNVLWAHKAIEQTMLCDDLIADKKLIQVYDGLDKVCERIRAAQKFILSPEFSVAADGLVDNIPGLLKITPFCRLPYPITWIEWLHNDRPHWDQSGLYEARPIDRTRHQTAPHRCGLLLEQQDNSAGRWKAHLFWSTKEKLPVETQHNGSLGTMLIDINDCDSNGAVAKRGIADFGQLLLALVHKKNPEAFERLMEYVIEDWGGEARFMIAVLGLLNTRNVAQTVNIDKTKENSKRVKHGKRLMFSHTLLKIRPQIYIRNASDPLVHQHSELRLHFVRGHFKQRRTGLFWWGMHARGSGKHGFIHKDYEVEV